MGVSIYSHGGVGEVTGSKHFLKTDASTVMIDCGAFQGKRQIADAKNREWDFSPEGLSAVVLSHAHYDHSGLLPLLSKKRYNGNIYATGATRDLAQIILMDSAKIQAQDEEFLRKQAKKRGEVFNWKPLYEEQDVIRAVEQFVAISYERPIRISRDIELAFYDAGHILGSALSVFSVEQDSKHPLTVVFSGDLGRKGKPIIKDPVQTPDPDYLVLESTYGNRLHEPSGEVLEKLASAVNDTVSRGGKLIIPAFAIERTQDIVFYLHLLVDAKSIPEIPIYVDSPMATNATTIYKIHPECYDAETHEAFIKHHKNPFGFNALRYIEGVDESKALNDMKEPMIIISSSGMCEAGRIQHHLLHNLSGEKNTVLIVGFMAKDTLGRQILEGKKTVRIFGDPVPVRAEIRQIDALSAHADYEEAWEYVSKMDLDKLKGIFLVHGEPDALTAFKGFLEGKGIKKVEIVEAGKEYPLV